MKKISLYVLALAAVLLLCMMPAVSAETLADCINNLVLPKQRYNIDMNQSYEMNNFTDASVNPQTGEFVMRQTDYTLPGRNGLDVNLTRIYRSGQATKYEMYTVMDGGVLTGYVNDHYYDTTSMSFLEHRHSIGAGWKFAFPELEIMDSSDGITYRYLHTESGAVYRLLDPVQVDGVDTYKLEGYKLDDKVVKAYDGSFPEAEETPKYMLVEKDGKKTYFSNDISHYYGRTSGVILGIKDRYGNYIKFSYQDINYTGEYYYHDGFSEGFFTVFKLLDKITDSVGREIHFEYQMYGAHQYPAWSVDNDGDLKHKFDVKVTTPDGQMIIYNKSCMRKSGEWGASTRERLQGVYTLEDASQYGVNGNYGEMKYYYGYEFAQYPFAWSGGDYAESITRYGNYWENIDFVAFGETNRAKEIDYMYSTKRFGDRGQGEARKVRTERDILLQSYTPEIAPLYWAPQNGSSVESFGSYVGEVVDRQSYYYATERYTGDTPEMKNIIQLSFEDENDLKRIKGSNKSVIGSGDDANWSMADTGYMSAHSLTNRRQSGNTKGSINLGKPGSYILHMKVKEVAGEQGAGTFTLGIEKADGSVTDKVIPVTAGEEWQTVEELLTDCSSVILKYNSTGGNFYIDDLVIGEGYYTVVNKLEEEPYLSDYQKYYYYSYDNLLRGTKESHVYGSEKSISWEYDERNQPSFVTTTVRDGYYDSDESQMHYDPDSIKTEQQYSYDNYGNLLSYSGPEYNGAHVEYTYAPPEKFHTVTSKTEKDESGNVLSQTDYTVDDNGNITMEKRLRLVTDSSWHEYKDYTYDTMGNLLSKTYRNWDGESWAEHYEYGALDEAHPASAGLYLTKKYSDTASYPVWYTYDYNTGLRMSEKQNNGVADIIKSYEYDAKHRLVKLSENRGDTIYRYHYKGMNLGGGVNEYNKIVEVETPQDHVLYTYNIYGDILSVKDFDTKAVRTAYGYSKRIDSETKLSSVTDANGNRTAQYDNWIGQLEKITYADGSTVKISYLDKTERLAQYGADQSVTVTDENGAETTHYLDKAGRVLAKETSPDGQTYYAVKHAYDALGNKVKTTDARGNVTTFEYDMLRRLTCKTDADGNEWFYWYNAMDKLAGEQAPDGKWAVYSYDGQNLRSEIVGVNDGINMGEGTYRYTSYDYNGCGSLTAKETRYQEDWDIKNADSKTLFVYDSNNRISQKREMLTDNVYRETDYTYDYNGNTTMEKTYANDDKTDYIAKYASYDNENRKTYESNEAYYGGQLCGKQMTAYFYDEMDHVRVKQEFKEESTEHEPESLETFYEYDLRYRVTKQTDPSSVVTEYEYDNAGNATKQTLSAGGKQYSTTRQYDLLGRLTSETNALEQTTRYGYDAAGNRTITVDARYAAQPLESAPSIRKEYDALNRPVKTLLFENGTSTVTQAREYDGRGNVTKAMDGEGYENGQVGTVMTYDFADNMITVASASAAAAGKVSKRMEYDSMGRTIKETVYKDAADTGSSTSYEYYKNGQLKKITDPLGNAEQYQYDRTGQLYEQKTDENGGVTKIFKSLFGTPYRTEYPDGTTETVDFDWYLGLAIAVADRKGRKKRYKYNTAKQVTEESFCYETDADGVEYCRVITYTYDAFGLLTEQKVSKRHGSTMEDQNQAVSYTYDALQRPTAVEKSDGSQILRQYDAAGNVTREQQRIAQGKYEERGYNYDAFGRRTSDFVMVDVHQLTDVDTEGFEPQITSYTYNKSGMIQSKTDANGYTTAYAYSVDGRLAQETSPSGATMQYSYDFAGNLLQETDAIGGYTKYDYDALGRISRKRTNPANDTDGELTWAYGYDAVGNLVSEQTPTMVIAGTDKKMTYTYDSMNRKTASYNADGQLLAAYQYDAVGNVIKTVDGLHASSMSELDTAAGTTYTYDSFDRVTSQTDAAGSVTSMTYNLRGDVTSQTDAKGQATTYTYNDKGRLASVSYPDGGQVGYTYDDKGRVLTKATKQSGSSTLTESYTYTPFDTVYQYTDAAGNVTKTLYDGTGKPSSVTDARGTKTRYSYNSDGRLAQKTIPMTAATNYTESYTYDGAGNVLAVTLAGDTSAPDRVTSYTYRPGGQIATMSNNAGALTEYSYDGAGNLAEQKVLRGYGSGAQYNTTSYTYDIYDRPVTMTRQMTLDDSGTTTPAVTSYTYNVMGMKTSETTPRSANSAYDGQYTTDYAYDTVGRLSQVSRRFNGQTVTTQYAYDALGNPVSVTDEAGHTTQYTYDAASRVTSVTDAMNQTTSYEYDLAGNRTKEIRPNGTWTYEYDAMNRLSVTKNPDGTVVQKLLYDANGNVVKQIDANGYAAGLLDSARYGTIYTYNLANMVEGITTPEGHTTTYAYTPQGDVKSVTDGTGHTTSYSYDAGGNVASVTNGAGETTAYAYDAAGNRIKMTDGLGHATEYGYGAFGLLLSVTDAAGRSIGYTYDLEGNVASMTDRGGRVTEYGYDNRGGLTSKTADGQSVTYSYDVSGNRTGMTDSTGAYTYTYDALNRMTAKSKDGAVQVSYGYDAVGNVTNMAYGGISVSYTYDNQNRLSSVSGGGASAGYSYDAGGNVTAVSYGSGAVRETRQYNKDGKVMKIENITTSGNAVYQYTYDGAGRTATKTDPYGTTSYTYDAAGRLVKASMPGKVMDYGYDAAGNRVSKTETSQAGKTYHDARTNEEIAYNKSETIYTYSATNTLENAVETLYNENIVNLVKNTIYSYDTNGNQYSSVESILRPVGSEAAMTLSQMDTALVTMTVNEYDVWNQLVKTSVTKNGETSEVAYTYDGDGIRTSRTVTAGESVKSVMYVTNGGMVLAQTGDDTAAYVRALGYVAKIGAENGVHYYQYNGHGDVVQVASGVSGAVENRYDYDAFGEALLAVEEVANDIRYSGEFYDEAAGLYYQRARYYAPALGQFTQEDTYRGDTMDPGSLNLYAYCKSDPVNFVDPSGHFYTDEDGNYYAENENEQQMLDYYYAMQGENPMTYWEWAASQGYDVLSQDQVNDLLYALSQSDRGKDPTESGGANFAFAEQFLMSLYETDTDFCSSFIRFYVSQDGHGVNQNMPKDKDGNNLRYQGIYGAGDGPPMTDQSDENGKPIPKESGPKNRYDDYEFGIFDALNWMIQTGGDINFYLQVRDLQDLRDSNGNFDSWEAKEQAAQWQAKVIRLFAMATGMLNAAAEFYNDNSLKVNMPKFYIGAVEGYADTLLNDDGKTGIYDRVIELVGGDEMIAGAYYGEDVNFTKDGSEILEKDLDLLRRVSDFIHEERGRKLMYIPYYTTGKADQFCTRVEMVAMQNYETPSGLRPMFDLIFLQPGSFFQPGRETETSSAIRIITNRIISWNRDQGPKGIYSTLGLQLEYDMGIVTGRDDDGYSIRNTEKKDLLNEYFMAVTGLTPNTPISSYSGGINEQGYSNPKKNTNRHNTGNHLVQDSGYQKENDDRWYHDYTKGNGVRYSEFSDAYDGNFVYDVNNWLYRDKWSPKLDRFGLEEPKKKE